ncbi:MAG: hypothetical protein GF409_04045 [Candidatus Omnitrophica bacterium]|nr:hypothetical protein [Candidatus Omnitrophota bacterium]
MMLGPKGFVWSIRSTVLILFLALLTGGLSDKILEAMVEIWREEKAKKALLQEESKKTLLAERTESWKRILLPAQALGMPMPTAKEVAFYTEEEVEP